MRWFARRVPRHAECRLAGATNLACDPHDAAVVEMISGIARGQSSRVIAECVESGLERDLMFKLGCPLWQGRLFGEPAPLAEFEAHLGSALDAP